MAGNKEAMRQAMEELLGMGDSIKDPVSPTVVESESAIFGDLRAEGGITISGRFKGSLTASGDIRVTGKVLGDITAATVTLDADAMVIGNVTCGRLDCAGKVKGDLTVAHAALFRAGAVLLGDVTAEAVEVHPDARLQGNVRQRSDDSEK